MAPATRRIFRHSVFCLNNVNGDDDSLYYQIMQDHLVDKTGRYEVIKKSEHWTKEGFHYVSIEYFENERPSEIEERY